MPDDDHARALWDARALHAHLGLPPPHDVHLTGAGPWYDVWEVASDDPVRAALLVAHPGAVRHVLDVWLAATHALRDASWAPGLGMRTSVPPLTLSRCALREEVVGEPGRPDDDEHLEMLARLLQLEPPGLPGPAWRAEGGSWRVEPTWAHTVAGFAAEVDVALRAASVHLGAAQDALFASLDVLLPALPDDLPTGLVLAAAGPGMLAFRDGRLSHIELSAVFLGDPLASWGALEVEGPLVFLDVRS
ncbi:MAG: hypothetical protein KC416_08440, partial [Myxococcales bacterium]|nr:hypothetical protein [Myxococcales bacterium]